MRPAFATVTADTKAPSFTGSSAPPVPPNTGVAAEGRPESDRKRGRGCVELDQAERLVVLHMDYASHRPVGDEAWPRGADEAPASTPWRAASIASSTGAMQQTLMRVR